MGDTPDARLLASICKAAGLVDRGIVTAPEFVNKVHDEFAHTEAVYPVVIAPLCEAVPASIRGEFSSAIRDSSRPAFRWRPFYIGTGPPLGDEELSLGTERIQAWSVALVRFLDGLPAKTAEARAPSDPAGRGGFRYHTRHTRRAGPLSLGG